jgi:S1-C subfamily serine protease
VRLTPVDTVVSMVVLRKGRQVPLQVKLKERPPQRESSQIERKATPQILPTGLETVALTDELSVQAGQGRSGRGVLVLTVPESLNNSLKLYDVILEAARVPVTSPAELERAVKRHSGSQLLLKVRRIEGQGTVERLVVLPR